MFQGRPSLKGVGILNSYLVDMSLTKFSIPLLMPNPISAVYKSDLTTVDSILTGMAGGFPGLATGSFFPET